MKPAMRMLAIEHTRTPGDMESRFRDRTGREHYDNGRYAPMSAMEPMEARRRRDSMGRYMRSDWDGDIYWTGDINEPDRTQVTSRYPGAPFPVYREHDGMRGGGYDMNRIGFNADREWEPDRTGMTIGSPMRNEMAYMPGTRTPGHAMGADSGMMMPPMSKEEAERWVMGMKNAVGTRGQHWTMEQAKQIMTRYGYKADPVEFYAALNMMKSDYTRAAQKVGADKEEFYAAMADAFLNDEDANEDKLALYHHYIAKKG